MQFNIPAEHKNAAGVYIIRNNIDARVYVGSASCFRKRCNRHRSALRNVNHHSVKLQAFVNKHGLDTLSFCLLEVTPPDKTAYIAAEQKHLDALRPYEKGAGFNIGMVATSRLGVKGKPLTQAQKEAITKAHKGKALSDEHRAALSAANKGRKNTSEALAKSVATRRASGKYECKPETRAKMSATRTGRKLNLSDEQRALLSAKRKGRRASPEARAKMSAAQKGRFVSPETRAKMSASQKQAQQNPEVGAKRAASLKKTLAERGYTKRPPVSEETKQKLSQAGKGRVFSPETRAKISAAQKGRKFSPELRAKMSALALARAARTRAQPAQSPQLSLL